MRARLAGLAAAAVMAVAGQASAQGSGADTLGASRGRGQLTCGVAVNSAGFALPDSRGEMRGLDADTCRAVAAAIFGDATKVRFLPNTTVQRFPMLQSGEIDMLARNTTWTLARETQLGLAFAGINFYDGQGFMVRRSSNVTSARQLDGATICVQPGTTTELNVSDYFRANKMQFKPVVINDIAQIQQAFFSGRCDVFTTDLSGLAATRKIADKPDEYQILPEAISKEPLGPMIRKGDWELFTIGRWLVNGLIEAEEYGITAANVDKIKAESKDPNIMRIVGTNGDAGKSMGLDNDWLVRAIKAVGNYGEIYERNIGPLNIPRGLNNLWNKGGVMYAPPIR